MANTVLLTIVVLSLCAYFASCETNYTNCDQDITVLERALYRPENIKALNNIFYPPRNTPARFVKVHYMFDDDDCNVTYIWAVGGFLLMQPPSIFQYTSLYFSTITSDLTDLKIQLPSECRPLVQSNCTCKDDDNNILDIVTQQLKVYAKFNDPKHMVRDTTIHVKAICSEELKDIYYSTVTKLFLSCTAIIPLFVIIIISTVVRSFHEKINAELMRKENHGNFASLITIGIFAQVVIVGIDIGAVAHVYGGYHELSKDYDALDANDYDVVHTINGFITMITLCFDSFFGGIMLLCILYLWCTLCHKDASRNCRQHVSLLTCCLECCLPCSLLPLFYIIFSPTKQERVWSMPHDYKDDEATETENTRTSWVIPASYNSIKAQRNLAIRRTSWVLLIMLVSPLFSIASHSGYILAAWLTEPSKATEIALITMAILIYTGLIFRQCYIANADTDMKHRCWSFHILLVLLYPFYYCGKHCLKCCPICCSYYGYYMTKHMSFGTTDEKELSQLLEGRNKNEPRESLNLQALCIVLGWGLWVVGSLTFTVIAFYEIPFTTLDLATYLLDIFQIFIVIIALLITYKVFMLSEPEIHRFIKKVRKAYEAKARPDNKHFDDLEAVGVVTGNALDAIINRA